MVVVLNLGYDEPQGCVEKFRGTLGVQGKVFWVHRVSPGDTQRYVERLREFDS